MVDAGDTEEDGGVVGNQRDAADRRKKASHHVENKGAADIVSM